MDPSITAIAGTAHDRFLPTPTKQKAPPEGAFFHDPYRRVPPMPLKPPFDATDPQTWPQNGGPLRITVHPYTPPQASTGNPTAADGIDDWYVPQNAGNMASYPDDWFVPAVSSSANSIQTAPNFRSAPGATTNSNTSAPPSNNSPAVRPDPLAAYWALIPASRAGAMAWHPPIFLPPNPFAPENIPASAWVTAPPIFPIHSDNFRQPRPNRSTSRRQPLRTDCLAP
jgi:hypothetical protein